MCFKLRIILLMLAATTGTIFARVCSPEYHPYTDYIASFADYGRKEFQRNYTGDYSQIVLDESRNMVIVGARNYVFMLTTNDLYPLKAKKWISTSNEKRCLQRGMSKMDCQNTIQLMAVYQDKLLICGSNSLNPVFNVTQLKNLDNVVEGNKNGFGKCSPKPSLKVVGSVTDIGEVIAGTFGDSMGSDPMISGTYMTPTHKRTDIIRTERWNRRMLRDPEFIDSFAVYPSVFIFFNEKANEMNGEAYATVGRICQGDNGGSDFILENTWTTYRKARLSCSAKGKSELNFKLLRSVTWSKRTKTFYAVFVTTKENLAGSTICAFTLSEIENAFEGDFLYRKSTSLPWVRTKNKKYFEGCTTKPSSLLPTTSQYMKQKVPPGKNPTNFLKHQALTDAFYYQLMYSKVNYSSNKINYLRPSARITQIAIDDITIRNGTKISIIYLSTDYGSILALYQPVFQDSACILEEVSLFKEGHGHPVKKMVIANKTKEMFVGTDVRFDRLELYNCERFKTESQCISARHPACGWNDEQKKCLSFKNVDFKKPTLSWKQDLSRCPSIRGVWAGWSAWDTCPQQEDRQKLCKCRKRRCRSIDPSECQGESVQVKHCSVTKVEAVSSWLQKGVIHGSWSPYSAWSKCGEGLCGRQFQTRTRRCTDPPPTNGGMMCLGKDVECQPCGKREGCPQICGEWTRWSPCRNNSGGATQTKERECLGSEHCKAQTSKVRMCKPKEIVWGSWSACGCDIIFGKEENKGIQHRIPACASRCSDIAGCQRGLVQYRFCQCEKPKPPNSAEVTSRKPEQKKFEMMDIILTSVITGIACLLISAVVVTLFIKRSKSFLNIAAKNERSGIDPEVLRTPIKKPSHVNGGPVVNSLDPPCHESTPLTGKGEIQEVYPDERVSPSISMTDSSVSVVGKSRTDSASELETSKI